jgi:AGZA family xanthine/uracil permease-like MFS transporter
MSEEAPTVVIGADNGSGIETISMNNNRKL